MKKLFASVMICTVVYGVNVLSPIEEIHVKGTTKDMVLKNNTLLIGTDQGVLQVYDYVKKDFIYVITLESVKDFMGDDIAPRVFSVDKLEQRYLLLSDSGKSGYSNLWIHEHNTTTQVLSHIDKIAAIKARFISKNRVLLGLLSNEAVLYDVATRKELFRVQLSESKFSDFALSEDKSTAVFSCESGVLNVIDTAKGNIVTTLKGVNVDNVYKVDYKKGMVSTAGQDRRAGLYDVHTKKGSYIKGSFLIYATALSPSARYVAFSMDEDNAISIYNTSTKQQIAVLKGQNSTLNTILFKDENILFSSSDDSTVMMWKLK